MTWLLVAWKFAKTIPWQIWLIGILVVIAVVYHLHAVNVAYDRGSADYKAKVEAANKASQDNANKAEDKVKTCLPPRHWNREIGRCEL